MVVNFSEAIHSANDAGIDAALCQTGAESVIVRYGMEQSRSVVSIDGFEFADIDDIGVQFRQLPAKMLEEAIVRTGKVARFDESK